MKITLYAAISIDGFIAKLDGDSDWVDELIVPDFNNEISKSDCIIVGRKSFKQFEGEIYPIANVQNIVVTSTPDAFAKYPNVEYTNASPKEVVDYCESKGFKDILLIGGGITSGSFYKAELVDEIIVAIQPIVLGSGIKMFETSERLTEFDLVENKMVAEGLIVLKFKNKSNVIQK